MTTIEGEGERIVQAFCGSWVQSAISIHAFIRTTPIYGHYFGLNEIILSVWWLCFRVLSSCQQANCQWVSTEQGMHDDNIVVFECAIRCKARGRPEAKSKAERTRESKEKFENLFWVNGVVAIKQTTELVFLSITEFVLSLFSGARVFVVRTAVVVRPIFMVNLSSKMIKIMENQFGSVEASWMHSGCR